MQRALAATFPRFAPWPWKTYPELARSMHVHDTTASVRWVIGDFNGDGRLDVAIDGNQDTVAYRAGGTDAPSIVAIFATGDSAIAVKVTNGALEGRTDQSPTARRTWLILAPRQTFRDKLTTDAVGVPRAVRYKELAPNQVYLWFENRFVQWADPD